MEKELTFPAWSGLPLKTTAAPSAALKRTPAPNEPATGGRRASAVPATTKDVTGADSKAENHAFPA